jgi:hypothetical protein
MSQETKRSMASAERRNLIFIVILLVGFTIYSAFGNSGGLSLSFGEDALTVTGPKDAPEAVVVAYEDIQQLSLVEDLPLGERVDGLESKSCQFGTWQNASYGSYTLCALPSVTTYLVIETEEGVVVCNYESAEATQSLYTAFQELLEKQGEGG